MTVDSIAITDSLVTNRISSSGSNLIILLIDGVIGYSSFAAIMVTVGSSTINYSCLLSSVSAV